MSLTLPATKRTGLNSTICKNNTYKAHLFSEANEQTAENMPSVRGGERGLQVKKLEIRKTINSVTTLRRLPVVRAVSVSKGAVKVFEKHIIC